MNSFLPSDFETLRSIPQLREVPDEQLRWFLDKSEFRSLKKGDNLFVPQMSLEFLFIILEGTLEVFIPKGENNKVLFQFQKGGILGCLPFSGIHKSPGYGQASTDMRLCCYPKAAISDMICEKQELTESFVKVLIFKAKNLTAQTLQNEKILALGKLTAGLSHELNNPISSIQRDTAELNRLFESGDLLELILCHSGLDVEEKAKLYEDIDIWKQASRPTGMNPSEIRSLEIDWLQKLREWGMRNPDDAAEVFTDSGIDSKELDFWIKKFNPQTVDNCLNGIQFYLKSHSLLHSIKKATGRVKDLTRAVKAFTHIDRNQIRANLNLTSGIENTLIILSHKIKASKIEIVFFKPEAAVSIVGLESELNQIWTNLIDNAIDALEGIAAPKLEIRITPKKDVVSVSITDNGTGIPEDIKSRIFEPFFTTKEIGTGSGVGLDLVNQIMMKHGGKISVDSVPGKTTFNLEFPKY